MSKKDFIEYKERHEKTLSQIYGGTGWRSALAGLLGGLAPSPTLDQLNGRYPKLPTPRSCSPYGTCGTPNAC